MTTGGVPEVANRLVAQASPEVITATRATRAGTLMILLAHIPFLLLFLQHPDHRRKSNHGYFVLSLYAKQLALHLKAEVTLQTQNLQWYTT